MDKVKTDFSSFLCNVPSSIYVVLTGYLSVILCKEVGIWSLITRLIQSMFPLFTGAFIAFLFEPLLQRMKMKRLWGSLLLYFVFFCFVAILIGSFIPLLIQQITDIAEHLDEYILMIRGLLQNDYLRYLSFDTTVFSSENYLTILDKTFEVIDVIKNIGLSFLAAFFISIDLPFLSNMAHKIIKDFRKFHIFYLTSTQVVFYYLKGMGLDLLFVFVTSMITLIYFGYSSFLFDSIILTLLQLLPYIGPAFAIILLLIFSYMEFGYIVWGSVVIILLLQQIESNIIQPVIFHKTMNLHPIVTLTFMVLLKSMFGILGLIISPVVAGIFQLTIQSYLYTKNTETVGTFEEIWYNFNDFQSEDEE